MNIFTMTPVGSYVSDIFLFQNVHDFLLFLDLQPSQQEEIDAAEESFDWEKYLAKNNAVSVPKTTFNHVRFYAM